jgi:hypothetical protein
MSYNFLGERHPRIAIPTMKVGSMPVEAGGFGSGDLNSRRPKPGNRSRSKPVGRRRRICRPAEQADHVSGAGRAWPAKIAPTLESPCPWRAVLPPIRPHINGPARGFHAFEPLAGGRNLNAVGRPLRSQRPSSMFQTYRGHRVDMRIAHGRSIVWPRRSRAQFLQSAEGQLTRPPRHRAVPLEIVAVQYVKFGL